MNAPSPIGIAEKSLLRKSRVRKNFTADVPRPLVDPSAVSARRPGMALHRTLDIVASAALLVLLSPLLIAVAALVKLTSAGPIFYSQKRVGLGGSDFTIYKFRSMCVDAERVGGPRWAVESDPRCTPIGGVLRRFGIDELPQLWNVLQGDMSLVGPRPERPFFVQKFSSIHPEYPLRHTVRPGITGWAQVNGWRGNTSLEKRIEYDLYYIENWSVRLDLKIMWLTLLRGFFHKHAY